MVWLLRRSARWFIPARIESPSGEDGDRPLLPHVRARSKNGLAEAIDQRNWTFEEVKESKRLTETEQTGSLLGRTLGSLLESLERLDGLASVDRALDLPSGVKHLLKSLVGTFLGEPRLIVPIGTAQTKAIGSGQCRAPRYSQRGTTIWAGNLAIVYLTRGIDSRAK